MTALMTGAMLFTAVPVGGGYAASNTAVNGVASTDCYVIETNFDSEKASRLYAGCTFSKNPKIRANRYSSTGNASDLKLWAVMKVNIPVTTFTLSDGSTVKHEIAEPTSWNSGWGSLSSNKDQATYLDNGESVTYIYGYKTTLSGINSSGSNTETSTLFDSMKVPDTINGKKVTKIKDLHSAVVVKGYIIPDDGYSSVADAYTKGSDTATESGNTIRDDDTSDIENQDEIDRLRDVVSEKEKVITALETRIEAQKPVGDAKAEYVLAGKSFSNSESLGVIGTMPDYGQSYNEKTTGYQTSLPSGTGLVRNSDGTITIKAGYHKTQVVQGASGNAQPSQVLSGVTYSNMTGPKTGTMTNYGYEPTASRLGTYNPGDGNYLYLYLPPNAVDNTDDAGNGYVQRSIKTKLTNLGNVSPSEVLSGKTFTSSSGLAQTGTMINHGGYTQAYSWATSGGTTYIRFPYGAYLTSANNGLNQPEITIADTLHSNADYINYGTSQYNSGYNDGKTKGVVSRVYTVTIPFQPNYGRSATLTYNVGYTIASAGVQEVKFGGSHYDSTGGANGWHSSAYVSCTYSGTSFTVQCKTGTHAVGADNGEGYGANASGNITCKVSVAYYN
jgi:hypothetical protein